MFLNKIKLFLVISICLNFFFLTYDGVESKEIKIISGIVEVTDGDTIRINDKKIRLIGIDAPEQKQKCKKTWLSISFLTFQKEYFCGKISTLKLKKLIDNKLVNCKSISKDRYNRYLAECFKNGLNINSWMVRTGHALAYRKYSNKYIVQENIAKRNKSGLWAGSFEMPWNWRKKN
jgi:endonuclease YncB( thermonuclease family)